MTKAKNTIYNFTKFNHNIDQIPSRPTDQYS